MSLASPQSVTYGGSAKSLPSIGGDLTVGEYQTADGTLKLSVSDTYKGRTRRVARLDFKKITASTFNPSTNVEVKWSCYLVLDVPANNVDSAEQIDSIKALASWLAASSYAVVTQIVGGEK